MKWLTDLWKRIVESDNQSLIDKNNLLINEVKQCNAEINKLIKEISEQEKLVEELTKENQILKEQLPTTFNIDDANLLDYFKRTSVKYSFKGKREYLHKSLNNFSEDTEYIEKYVALLIDLGLKDSYKDEDAVVYATKRLIDDYVDDGDNYDTDLESFGKREWWLTPQESFDYYIKDEGDCDDKSALLYGAIISALKYFGYDHYTWRLLRFDMTQPVGHAICIWLRRNGLWKRIESTYYSDSISRTFYNDKTDIFLGEYVKVYHIFNEEHEYKLK